MISAALLIQVRLTAHIAGPFLAGLWLTLGIFSAVDAENTAKSQNGPTTAQSTIAPCLTHVMRDRGTC
jgi:hypothetical protein